MGEQQLSNFSLHQHTKLIHLWTRPGFFLLPSLGQFSGVMWQNHSSMPTSLDLWIASSELYWGCSDISISFNVKQLFFPQGPKSYPRNALGADLKPQGKSLRGVVGALKAKGDQNQGRDPQTGKSDLKRPTDHQWCLLQSHRSRWCGERINWEKQGPQTEPSLQDPNIQWFLRRDCQQVRQKRVAKEMMLGQWFKKKGMILLNRQELSH